MSTSDASSVHLLWEMIKLALPLFLSTLVETSLPIITFLRVGRLGKEELAAAALGSMLCNASAFATGLGLSTALNVTCAQAFGAKNYPLVGRQCQRMMLLLSVFTVPTSLLWQNSEFVFLALQLPLSDLAQEFTRSMIFGVWPYFMFDCLRRYLSSQKITWPITFTAVTTIVTHIVVSERLVDMYGLPGAGYANSIAYWMLFLLLSATTAFQIRVSRKRGVNGDWAGSTLLQTWPSPLSWEVLRGWTSLLRLGLPSALSLLVEWGTFELNAAITGQLGIIALATHSVYAQYSALFYALPSSFAQAAATIGSNSLGAGHAHIARRVVALAYVGCMACGVLQGCTTLANRDRMGSLFSADADVIRMSAEYAPILCVVYEMSDVFKCAGMVFLRETGRPAVCFWAVAASTLLFGLPLSYMLGLRTELGLWGVWLGMSLSWVVCGIVYALVLHRTDWAIESMKAIDRSKEGVACSSSSEGRTMPQRRGNKQLNRGYVEVLQKAADTSLSVL